MGGPVERQVGAGRQDLGLGVHLGDGRGHRCQVLRGGGVDLVDDDHVGHAQVRLTRVEAALVAGTQGVGHHYQQVRQEEGQVIVAAIPEDDIGLLLRLAQDGFVVDPGEDDAAGLEVRLVLLAFLDGGVVAGQIVAIAEALHALCGEIAVGHGMADHHRCQPTPGQQRRHGARGLALAGTGAHRAHRDDRLGRFEHHAARSDEAEVCTGGHRARGGMHHGLVWHIAIAEDDKIHVMVVDHGLKLRLGHDGDALGVLLSGQFRRVAPPVDAGDLGGREGHHLRTRIVAIDDVEVMEIASCGAHDHDLRAVHDRLPCAPGSAQRSTFEVPS